MKKFPTTLTAIAVFLCGFIAPSVGAWDVPIQAPDTAVLETRAQAYWDARKVNDLFAAWEFEDHKALGTATLQQYVQKGAAMKFTKAQVTGSDCPGDSETCIVIVDVEYVIPALGRKPLSGQVKDEWGLIDGQWYRTPERRTSPVRNWE
jgi:hypothetical protein